ncbi:neutral/alkaline non-lysosomal ceramidase N-terminal domain-containing protein [Paenibacillus ginsengarvi]|nr:neutral/alkaline non-lysosomal ceramidase N-terminal domain-containing protein [Paenibacillus ginsengarvi]
MIRCGMAEVEITPKLGSVIPGYFGPRHASGVKDSLYAKSLVVESGENTVVIVVLDSIFVPESVTQTIRERVAEDTGIGAAAVLVSATHTHTGGPVSTGFGSVEDPAYLAWAAQKAADSVLLAYRTRKEARIGFGRGHEADIAFNRRFWMKDGSFRTNPGVSNPLIDRAAGPIDPEVLVMRIDDAAGNPIGVVTNYACHTDTVGGAELCADYPGELSRCVKRELGEQAVSLFLLGACGDINHIDVSGKYRKGADHYRWMGRILGAEAIKVREKIRVSDSAPVAALSETFTLKLRSPSQERIDEARRIIETGTDDTRTALYAREIARIADENPPVEATVEVQAVRIGELAIAGLPGEIFVEFGLDIKRRSAFGYTMIDTLSNGTIRAYICTREAYRQGGYEPQMTFRNRFPEETGERLVESAARLLDRLNEAGSSS